MRRTKPCRLWKPLVLSVVLHGLLVGLMTRIPFSDEPSNDRVIDTRVRVDAVQLALTKPPQRSQTVFVSTPSSAPSEPVIPTVKAMPVVKPSSQQTGTDQQRTISQAPPTKQGSVQNSSNGGSGEDQAVTDFFQIAAHGRSVVYVIDRSLSMGLNGALAFVKSELSASLDRLPPDVRFQVVFYNRLAQPLRIDGHSGLLPASAANKQRFLQQLQSLVAEGGTNHMPALRRALDWKPDVIFFLTDADDLDPKQVRFITRLNHGRAAIHTIELSNVNRNRDQMPLHELARLNNGSYQAVATMTHDQ